MPTPPELGATPAPSGSETIISPTDKDDCRKSTFSEKLTCSEIVGGSIGRDDSFQLEKPRMDDGHIAEEDDLFEALQIEDEPAIPVSSRQSNIPVLSEEIPLGSDRFNVSLTSNPPDQFCGYLSTSAGPSSTETSVASEEGPESEANHNADKFKYDNSASPSTSRLIKIEPSTSTPTRVKTEQRSPPGNATPLKKLSRSAASSRSRRSLKRKGKTESEEEDEAETSTAMTPATPRYAMRSKRLKMVVILQSGLSDDDYEKAKEVIEELGGSITDDSEEATVSVANHIRSSVNQMCALGKRIPMVTMQWIVDSEKRQEFVATKEYILKDPVAEEKYKINVERVVSRDVPFLQDWKVACSYRKGVKGEHFLPSPEEIAKLTRCCGGVFTEAKNLRGRRVHNNNLLVVRSAKYRTDEEKRIIEQAKERSVKVIDVSRFFTCCGRQSKIAFQSAIKKNL